ISNPDKNVCLAMKVIFIVTIIVFTMTGLVLLVTVFWDPSGGLLSGVTHDASLEAGALTSAAFSSTLGIVGEYIVSISVVFFGFSTIIGWYVYGIKCFEYLFGVNHLKTYGVIYVADTFIDTVANLTTVCAFANIANCMMI